MFPNQVEDLVPESEFQETSKRRQQTLVYVDVETNDDGSLKRIEILTPSSQEESRWISETSSEDLAAGFIKDLKEMCRPGQVLVVSCLVYTPDKPYFYLILS